MNAPEFTSTETPRLLLRRLKDGDLPTLLAYHNDPEVARYQLWEDMSEAAARAFVNEQKSLRPGVPGQWFVFALERKDTHVHIGDCSLKVSELDERQGEIGFNLARDQQGKGYAAEAVSSVLDYAFDVLELHRVIAVTDCENAASVALLERVGMRREGHFIQNIWFKGKWGDEYHYAVLRHEWTHRRRRPAS